MGNMFCVNCGNQLEEEWKVCPKCGVEVVRQQKKEQNVEKPKQRVCEKCGNELKEDWLKCPFCGYTEEESYTVREVDTSKDVKKFKFEGFRRTGRFGFQYYKSEVEINDNEIHTVVPSAFVRSLHLLDNSKLKKVNEEQKNFLY